MPATILRLPTNFEKNWCTRKKVVNEHPADIFVQL